MLFIAQFHRRRFLERFDLIACEFPPSTSCDPFELDWPHPDAFELADRESDRREHAPDLAIASLAESEFHHRAVAILRDELDFDMSRTLGAVGLSFAPLR